MLKEKYEIDTGLPHSEGCSLESVSGTPPFAQLILDSSGPRVEDSNDTPFTLHTLFVFFGDAEVSEALAGVFLVSSSFPLSLVDCFRLLWLVVPFECFCSQRFLVMAMRLSTLGLVGATSSSCT
jgi:hypothetical protein